MPEKPIPEGHDFLRLMSKLEDDIETATDERIPAMGKKAPLCFGGMGTLLSHLDRLASCFYGCRGGDHLFEYLAGRVCNLSRSSLRLMRFGFYDEALSMVRSVGEVANLVQLFASDAELVERWKAAPPRERERDFSPYAVRVALEKKGVPLPLGKDWYKSLCERAVHATPGLLPNSFNHLGVPTAAPFLQDAGVLVCLNELGSALCIFSAGIVKAIDLEPSHRTEVLAAAGVVAENLGAVTLRQLPDLYASN